MHIKGRWSPLQRGAGKRPNDFEHLTLSFSPEITSLEDDRYRLIYEGAIFDATAGELLANPSLLDRAFGFYTFVLFDKKTGDVYLGTDRLGYSSLYYSVEGNDLLFSSSPTLLKSELKTVTPNLDAWDEILSLGDIIGEKTVIKEMIRLPWGKKIRLTPERVEFLSVWTPELPDYVDPDTYIRKNNELLAEAVSLTGSSGRQKVVLLSGGEDSRRLAIAARHCGLPFICASQASIGKNDKDADVPLAMEVSAELGVPCMSVPLADPAEIHRDRLLKDHWTAYETHYHEWIVKLFREIPAGSLVYDGIIADVTVNGHYFHLFPSTVSRWDPDFLTGCLGGHRRSAVDPKLLSSPLADRLRAEFARFPDTPHRLTYYFLLNHTRRTIGSWFQLFYLHGHVPCLPYAYYPFFLQSFALEPQRYLDGWMQRRCMEQVNPKAAAIPTTRNPVPARYLLDRSDAVIARRRFNSRHVRLRDDAKSALVRLKRHVVLFEALSLFGLQDCRRSPFWAAQVVGRYSEFLDWLEDRKVPAFPVECPPPRPGAT